TRLLLSAERLVCAACSTAYEVRPPGIPRLMSNQVMRRNLIHEQQWDSISQEDYDQICRENRLVWDAIDAFAMRYCSGLVLEVCCGNGRFLDVLTRDSRVKQVTGLDVSIGMLRAAWAKGHRCLIQGSADDLPIRSSAMDTVASSGSG